MPPLPGSRPASRPRAPSTSSVYKPPLPILRGSLLQYRDSIEVQVPPIIAGALIAAFAAAVADGLNNELLTHYYLSDQKVRLNLDRVMDRLITEFSQHMWDELFQFYQGLDDVLPRQIKMLFEGPIRQIILSLNGPEMSRCILEKIAPGLSRRPVTWSANSGGISLTLALQILCSYWHREYASRSPGGNPEEIARTLERKILGSEASKLLIANIRTTLVSPHFVQMHIMESAVWDIILQKPRPPPSDGFHVVQFKFECQLFGPQSGISDPQLVSIGSLPAITGTASEHISTSIADYVMRRWPRCGHILLSCLEEAVKTASDASQHGGPFSGMSVWDAAGNRGVFSAGLRLLHVEVEDAAIRLSVSAWSHTLIQVLQQTAWTCAALSASPFPGALSECAVELAGWEYQDDAVYVNCSLAHRPVAEGEGSPSLCGQLQGAALARGFPVHDFILHPS